LQSSQLQQSLKRASKELGRASKELGIDIEIPFILDLPCGRIEAEALVKGFGYERGVVINIRGLGGLHKHLADFGYGAATLSELANDDSYDSAKWIMRCRAWGWSGENNPPDWY